MGVSKNRDTSKWMVKIMENPIKMDDLGGKPTIFGNIHIAGKMILEFDNFSNKRVGFNHRLLGGNHQLLGGNHQLLGGGFNIFF